MSPSKEELAEIGRELERLRERLHDISERERAVGERMHPTEVRAMAIGAVRIATAMRASFVSLTNAGALMTQAHIDMNVPPTIFRPELVEVGTPEEEQEHIDHETAISEGKQSLDGTIQNEDAIEEQTAAPR